MHKHPDIDPWQAIRLTTRIARGDQGAFAEFVDAYGPRVQSLARRYAGKTSDAEDLTQEILLALYRSAGSFRGKSTLSTWVYGVALNLCLKHCERKPVATQPLDETVAQRLAGDGYDPVKSAAMSELQEKVRVALTALSPEHREVVILHELQDLTYSECAIVLGIPVGTVKSRLYYAFRLLRDSLTDYVRGADLVGPEQDATGTAALGTIL